MARKLWMIAALVAFALIAAACGTSSNDTTTTTETSGGGDLSGTILISGSSTVEPISARVAEDFSTANPGVGLTVEGPGTGDGFKKFCAGETDISDASRPIKDTEIDACKEAGIEWIELHLAIDGLSVLTSHDNEQISTSWRHDDPHEHGLPRSEQPDHLFGRQRPVPKVVKN